MTEQERVKKDIAPQCCVCDVQLDSAHKSSFLHVDGRLYRTCEKHKVVFLLTIHALYQLRGIESEANRFVKDKLINFNGEVTTK